MLSERSAFATERRELRDQIGELTKRTHELHTEVSNSNIEVKAYGQDLLQTVLSTKKEDAGTTSGLSSHQQQLQQLQQQLQIQHQLQMQNNQQQHTHTHTHTCVCVCVFR